MQQLLVYSVLCSRTWQQLPHIFFITAFYSNSFLITQIVYLNACKFNMCTLVMFCYKQPKIYLRIVLLCGANIDSCSFFCVVVILWIPWTTCVQSPSYTQSHLKTKWRWKPGFVSFHGRIWLGIVDTSYMWVRAVSVTSFSQSLSYWGLVDHFYSLLQLSRERAKVQLREKNQDDPLKIFRGLFLVKY